MKYCKQCVMPDTKPGVILDKHGICQACNNYEKRKRINWQARQHKLIRVCNNYRRKDDYYDCIVAVSGGKDSYFQVYMMKNIMKMNPLLVSASTTFSWTEVGRHNFKNLGDVFDCDTLSLDISPTTAKKMTRIFFEEYGFGSMPMDLAIYVFPIRVAINYKIPLVVYGENVSYEYGDVQIRETPSALQQIYNTVARPIDLDYWQDRGVYEKELNALIYPTKIEIKKARLDPIYLSFYMPWDGYDNYQLAKKYGFRNLSGEWCREGYIEHYDQIDTVGYLMNAWLKYPKFGFSRVTDVCCYWIRSGKISRDEAIECVRIHNYRLDRRILDDWLDFTGYTEKKFWSVVDGLYNRDIFHKINGIWKLKHPIWEKNGK